MMKSDLLRITIIGGGASGTLLAANLLKNADGRSLEINLVEKSATIGSGVAFSTPDEVHLLNVPAGKMGAFPDEVESFHRWLLANEYSYEPHSFVPRKMFGQYLRSVVDDAAQAKSERVKFNVFEDDAVDMVLDEGKAVVSLGSGDAIYSEKVVLAFGNFLPPEPSVRDLAFTKASKYFRSPWTDGVYDSIDDDDDVFVIGTGLSMVDVVMHLFYSPHRGNIYALSTRGLLPAVHKLGDSYPSFSDELKSMDRITDMLKTVRRHIKIAAEQNIDWRAVIDSLRPATQEIWLNLPVAEKKYFKQHLSRYWNVARHRMPVEAAIVLDRLQAEGRLHILKGRLKHINFDARFDIKYTTGEIENTLAADSIINCIGSESNFERLDAPLVINLFQRGYVRNDALNMGLDALPNGVVVGKNGEASGMIYTLGTALKGILWESTAVPEIRSQAHGLASHLLSAR
jgi:uncharacterized NAD(P)/FAD-binding protein YdhS